MTNITPATQVNLLTKLPAPSGAIPQLSSGIVSLFQDENWTSQRLDLNINDYAPNQRQTIPNFMTDQATYIAFNLPIGTVMTLMDNIVPVPSGGNVADLSGCGRSVDLVGTGQTEAVNLMADNENDCISSFFWRTVDLDIGAIEVFGDINFGGNRSTIFLSEWNSGTIYSITSWWLQDQISSIRWRTLNDRQTAVMFDNQDGTGNQYNNIKGWGSTKEISNLADISFNDAISAFRWESIVPVKEIIAPFNIIASSGTGSSGLSSVVNGTNNSSVEQPVTVSINNETAQTVTLETMDQTVTGFTYTVTAEETVGIDGDEEKTTWSVGLNFTYTQSTTKTTSETQTIALNISQTINAPPMTNYTATLLVSIGQLPPTVYSTSAQRWYTDPVAGSQQDPTNNNWYKRIEPVTVSMSGSLASNATVNINATPLS
ncbi:hypothetical protein OIDMADRAFT_59956 [Oidiodendron maius Zn]|uniref:Uncharacterized protein n=1 Tax=Oidiodendron maius (strain Zn) TaxID=913774 RepID=A0A0C3C999_OIDMZ|nr:hypothetical protein OIDMADRAFT_59956 [Oidiodendron maius Zn]